jgi:uncharacterized MnhB-related membrane protein
MTLTWGLMATAIFCAFQAICARRLLVSALWLAAVSALVAIALYRLGAPEVAVIELSVGAGLVTILFVFAITIAGDEVMSLPEVIPRLLRWLLLVGIVAALGWFIRPVEQAAVLGDEAPFTAVLWQARGLDVLVQIGLIFAGVMGILGLLSEQRVPETVTTPIENPSYKQPASSPVSRPPDSPAKEKLA